MVISSKENNATAVNGRARSIHICGEIGDGRETNLDSIKSKVAFQSFHCFWQVSAAVVAI